MPVERVVFFFFFLNVTDGETRRYQPYLQGSCQYLYLIPSAAYQPRCFEELNKKLTGIFEIYTTTSVNSDLITC